MGADLTITRNGVAVPLTNRRTATRVTSAKQTWALNADDTVAITVESTTPLTFAIGDEITVFGRDYRLNRLPKINKGGTLDFKYDLEFEGVQYDLLRVTYDVNIDTTSNQLQDIQGESLTGDLHRFMTVLISNMNRVFPNKWEIGSCPETAADKTLTFGESDNCLAVLQNLCKEENFNVEFEIVKKATGKYAIDLKPQVGQTLPYVFRYGRGLGLYALNRQNVSNANIVTRLKVFGSTENITSKYRADRLCLPGKTKGQSYIQSDVAIAKYGVFEGRKNFDDIKPTFTGEVTSVTDNVLEFIDTNFPFDLNELEEDGVTTKYLIDGLAAKIHFNTGNLAGYEFEIHSYDHASHKFTLVRQTDERGYSFPSDTSAAFQIQSGVQYKIIDVAYPDSITEEAEQKLLEAADTYYSQNSQPKVQYGLTVTKMWLQNVLSNQSGVVNVFAPGDFVQVIDEDIAVDKAIRIKSFVRNILDPYDYSLTISDTTTSASIANNVLSELIDIDKIITINNLGDPAKARARWRSSREVLNMIFDPEGYFYTDKIAPAAIDTMMLSVGAKSMQFGLVGTRFEPNAGGDVNAFAWVGGTLTHYTIDEAGAVFWNLANGRLTNLNPNTPYYIYAKCSRSYGSNRTGGGTISISPQQIKFDEEANCYNFLVGILNSVDADLKVRTISLTYGFSTINGRFIKTGRIESSGGANSYFDLDDGSMNLGDKLIFNKDGDGRLLLKGTFVQSQSGDTFPAGCYRGVYVPGVTYYQGDIVTYTDNGMTSTYICLDTCTNVPPTNVQYWSPYAQGSKGEDGADGINGKDGISPNTAFKSTVFKRSQYAPAKPTGGSYANPVPSGWSDGIPSGELKLWGSTRVFSSDGLSPQQDSWTTPVQITDTADFDVEFSSVENPDPPTGHPNTNTQWSNQSDESTIWMATSRKSNGVWDDWQVSKIKGESGEDGTSVHILGEVVAIVDNVSDATSAINPGEAYLVRNNEDDEDSPCWVVSRSSRNLVGVGYKITTKQASEGDGYILASNGHLYVASISGGNWVDAGVVKGDKGENGTNGMNAFVHIKFANSLTENDWTANNGETPGAYIGIYSDNNSADQLVWSLYSWTKWKGDDGFGYEYIYKLTSTSTAPATPTDAANQTDDYVPSGWTDDPQSVSETYPYCWVCYRKKTDGLWGKFIGSSSDNTKAALWAKYGKDGSDGATGADGTPGNYTEFRFAVNGSTTSAPSIVVTARTPAGWSLTKPTMTTAQYMWMSFAIINGKTNALVQNWSTPVRVTGEKGATGATGANGADGADGADGKDGENGKSPAMVFRGEYSASKTYYGNETRLDCVRYNGAYYIARIDAPTGSFSGKTPTNTSYWNSFGASFESVATELLLAENANIAGWIFKNNRLESANGSMYLDGVNGVMRSKGTIQLSTGYTGNFSDVNLFHLPAITSQKSITMGYEDTDIGKVCRLFNSSPLGGASYIIACHTFGIKYNPSTGIMQSTDATLGTIYARLDPQEFIELTCFEMPPGDYNIKGSWQMTSRMAVDNWRMDGASGRFPRMLAMGRMTYSNGTMYLSGYMWNGVAISSVMTPTRASTGNYKLTFASNLLPDGYKVMVNGYGHGLIDARVISTSSTLINVGMSDDASYNDGNFDFWIFDPKWYYPLS